MFDVPGEYSQIPWTPFGASYQLTETGFTYQGIGLGGNSQFNGMLMQTNPPAAFDQRWPAGWHWADMAQYFDRVRQRIPVTSTPSTDGVPQNTGTRRHRASAVRERRLGRDGHEPALRRGGRVQPALRGGRQRPAPRTVERLLRGRRARRDARRGPRSPPVREGVADRIRRVRPRGGRAIRQARRAGPEPSRHRRARARARGRTRGHERGRAGHAAAAAAERRGTARPRGRDVSRTGARAVRDRQPGRRRGPLRPRHHDGHVCVRRRGAVRRVRLRRLRGQRGRPRALHGRRQRSLRAIPAGIDPAAALRVRRSQRRGLPQPERRGHARRAVLGTAHVQRVRDAARRQGARRRRARRERQRDSARDLPAADRGRRGGHRPHDAGRVRHDEALREEPRAEARLRPGEPEPSRPAPRRDGGRPQVRDRAVAGRRRPLQPAGDEPLGRHRGVAAPARAASIRPRSSCAGRATSRSSTRRSSRRTSRAIRSSPSWRSRTGRRTSSPAAGPERSPCPSIPVSEWCPMPSSSPSRRSSC